MLFFKSIQRTTTWSDLLDYKVGNPPKNVVEIMKENDPKCKIATASVNGKCKYCAEVI